MKKFRQRVYMKNLVISVLAVILLNLILLSSFKIQEKISGQEKNILAMKAISNTIDNVKREIYLRIMIFKGYEAYVMTNESVSEETTMKYLEILVGNDPMIRNVGIIRGTVSDFVYPKEGNESVLGKDFLEIENQRESILKVKEKLEPIFFGPVDLVQGGKGYIARTPIIVDNKYWGQISIVLKADEVNKMIMKYSKMNNLKVAFFKDDPRIENLVMGDLDILKYDPVFEKMYFLGTTYSVAFKGAIDSNIYNQLYFIYIILVFCTIGTGFITYRSLNKSLEIKIHATTDILTGVHNRHYLSFLSKKIDLKIEEGKEHFGLMVIDINYFKQINDNYGHQAGDYILKSFAQVLKEVCRKTETVFRTGGDEFLVVFEGIREEDVFKIVIERIKSQMPESFEYNSEQIPFSISIGSSFSSVDGTTFEDLYKIADKRMYEEKSIYHKK